MMALAILNQDGVSAFSLKNRRLSKILQTAHGQQKEAASGVSVVETSSSPVPLPSQMPIVSVPDTDKSRNLPSDDDIAKLNNQMQREIRQRNEESREEHESDPDIVAARTDEIHNRRALDDKVTEVRKQQFYPDEAMKDTLLRQRVEGALLQESISSGLSSERAEALEKKAREWLQGGDVCWKSSSQRGVGTIPNACTDSAHPNYQAGLCYASCPSGQSNGVGPVCWSVCPSGYTDIGALCSFSGTNVYGKGCCCTVFGCCHNCNSGYTDVGCLCQVTAPTTAKSSSPRGAGLIPTGCPSGRNNEAGLCYNSCPSGSVGLATTCWSKCSGALSTDCGASCASSSGACAGAVYDMVSAPLMIAIDLATDGALGTAVKTGTSIAKTAMESGVSALVKAAASKIASGLAADAVKGTIQTMAKGIGAYIKDSAVTGIVDYAAHTTVTGSIPTPDLDMLTALDPTGISGLIIAYAHPIC